MGRAWKGVLLVTLASVLVLLLTVFGIAGERPEAVRVTYNPLPLNVPSIISRHEGILESYMKDVKVEYGTFLAGYLMTEAMAAGDLDIAAVMGGTSAITSKAGGRNIKILCVYGLSPKGFAIVVRPDAGFASVKDLAGKKVAAPVGTEAHYLLARGLEEVGLTTKDVQLVNMLVPDAASALLGKEVDAAVIVEPVMSKLAGAGKIRILRDGEGLIAGATFTVGREDFIKKYPDVVDDYLRAHRESLKVAEEDPDKTVSLVAAEVKLPEPLVKRIIPKYTFRPDVTDQILAELQTTADFLFKEGIIKRRVDVNDLVDRSFID